MGITGTFLPLPLRALMAMALTALLSACEIDDTVLCDDQDASQSETCPEVIPYVEFKVQYTTADGNLPAGRFGFVPSGAAVTDELAELEAHLALQYVFNTNPAFIEIEKDEIVHYRGNICGAGFVLRHGLADIHVKRTRRTGANTFDYDLELTCTN